MKDYSRNSYRTDQPKFSSKRLGNIMLALACVFALAALSDFMYQHWDTAHKMIASIKTFSQKAPAKKNITVAHQNADAKKTSVASAQPRFDFYKLLPEMTVTIPKKDNDSAKN